MADPGLNIPEFKWADAAETPSMQAYAAPPQLRERKMRGPLAAIGSAVLLGLSKLKFLVIGLKALPFAKFAFSGLSMLLMIWVYAERGGWVFGVGFVLLLLIHELGHAAAIKKVGLRASWPVFIPFLGAMINLKDQPRTPHEEAVIAYGGPLVGTLASAAMAAVYFATGSTVALSLAYTGFFLNLFNMVPIRPLDGGRVAQAFSRRAWIIGLVLLAGLFFLNHAPQLILIGALALAHAVSRKQQAPTALSTNEQARWAVLYFGLILFLGGAMYVVHQILEPGGSSLI